MGRATITRAACAALDAADPLVRFRERFELPAGLARGAAAALVIRDPRRRAFAAERASQVSLRHTDAYDAAGGFIALFGPAPAASSREDPAL